MRLVHQHQIALLDAVGLAVDRLDAGKQDTGAEIATAQPGGIDAGGSIGPEAEQFGMVLGDQFADVGDDQDALVGPLLQHLADEAGHDQTLAARGRDHHQRMTDLAPEIVVDGVDGRALVRTEGQHGALPSVQRMPSGRR